MEQTKRTTQILVRFTKFETGFLTWYAKNIDTDRANAIQHVLGSFLADHNQLIDRYLKEAQTSSNVEET